MLTPKAKTKSGDLLHVTSATKQAETKQAETKSGEPKAAKPNKPKPNKPKPKAAFQNQC
jgi:hypothetical protein